MTETNIIYRKEPSLLWHGVQRTMGTFSNLNKTGGDLSDSGIKSAVTAGLYFAAKFAWAIPFIGIVAGPVIGLAALGAGYLATQDAKSALYNKTVDRYLTGKVAKWREKGNQFKPGIAQRLKLAVKKAYGLALTVKSAAVSGLGIAMASTGATLIAQSVIAGLSAGMTGVTTVAFKAAAVVATSGLPAAGAITTLGALSVPLVAGMVAASVVGVVAGTVMAFKGYKGARQNYKQKFVNVTYEDVSNKPDGAGLKLSLPKFDLSKIGFGKKTAFNSKSGRGNRVARKPRTRRPARARRNSLS